MKLGDSVIWAFNNREAVEFIVFQSVNTYFDLYIQPLRSCENCFGYTPDCIGGYSYSIPSGFLDRKFGNNVPFLI